MPSWRDFEIARNNEGNIVLVFSRKPSAKIAAELSAIAREQDRRTWVAPGTTEGWAAVNAFREKHNPGVPMIQAKKEESGLTFSVLADMLLDSIQEAIAPPAPPEYCLSKFEADTLTLSLSCLKAVLDMLEEEDSPKKKNPLVSVGEGVVVSQKACLSGEAINKVKPDICANIPGCLALHKEKVGVWFGNLPGEIEAELFGVKLRIHPNQFYPVRYDEPAAEDITSWLIKVRANPGLRGDFEALYGPIEKYEHLMEVDGIPDIWLKDLLREPWPSWSHPRGQQRFGDFGDRVREAYWLYRNEDPNNVDLLRIAELSGAETSDVEAFLLSEGLIFRI